MAVGIARCRQGNAGIVFDLFPNRLIANCLLTRLRQLSALARYGAALDYPACVMAQEDAES